MGNTEPRKVLPVPPTFATWTDPANQSAARGSPLGQTAVKPFAIRDLQSPTFFQWRDNSENGAAIQGEETSCSVCRSVLKFSDGRWCRTAGGAEETVQVAASRRLL